MLVTRFNPFKEMRDLEQKLFRYYPAAEAEENGISAFKPTVSTREGEFAYHVEVDLPGVKKEDISIDIKENTLVISGERRMLLPSIQGSVLIAGCVKVRHSPLAEVRR